MNAAWTRSRDWLQRQLLRPLSNGLLGFATAFAFYFGVSLIVLFPFGAGEQLATIARANGSAPGIEAFARSSGFYPLLEMLANFTGFSILEVGLTTLAAITALFTMLMTAFMVWIWVTTIGNFAIIGRALNGQFLSRRESGIVALSNSILLILLVSVYGVKIWLFVVWEALLLCGVMVVAWRLVYPAKRDFFGIDARVELEAARQVGKSLGIIFLVVCGFMLSGHAKIAALPWQWIFLLMLFPAGLLLSYGLTIVAHVRDAISIAVHERNVYQIRNRDT